MAKHVGEEVSGSYDAIVIGGGIMGSCTAYQVAKRDKCVLLLEQYDFLHRRGSSHGESRTIRVSYPEEYYAKMMQESYKLWEEAEHEAGYVVSQRTGQLDFGAKDDLALQAVMASLKSTGMEHEVLSSSEVSARFPEVHIGPDKVAVYTPTGGVLRASKAVAMFQSLAVKHGAVLRDHARVVKVTASSGVSGVNVVTSRGSAHGKRCVIAAGAWTGKLVKDICGLELPIQPVHTAIAYWEVDKSVASALSAEKGFPVFASYGSPELYGTPSLEYPGLIKVSVHGGKALSNPDEHSFVPDVEGAIQEVVSPFLAEFFKGLVRFDAPVLAEACMYSMTPDEDFILDFVAGSDSNILVAGGFSGHGFKFGPLVGRIMADLAITGICVGVPLEVFAIQRFTERAGGNGNKGFHKQVAVGPVVVCG